MKYTTLGVIMITLSPSELDVNVEVDKSAVICKNESKLVELVTDQIYSKILRQERISDFDKSQRDFYESVIATPDKINHSLDVDTCSVDKIEDFSPESKDNQENSRDSIQKKQLSSKTNERACSLDREKSINLDECGDKTYDELCFTESQVESYGNNLWLWNELEKELVDDDLPHNRKENKRLYTDNDEVREAHPIQRPESSENVNNNNQQIFQNSCIKHSNVIVSPEIATTPKPLIPKKSNNHIKMPKESKTGLVKQNKENIPQNGANKRESIFSYLTPEKRRKTTSGMTGNKKRFIFKIAAAQNSYVKNSAVTQHCPPYAYIVDTRWFIIWNKTLYAFNPTRAQETNIFNKLMACHALKYGPKLCEPYELTLTKHFSITQYLGCLDVISDGMGQETFLKSPFLTVSGIRIKRDDTQRYFITNIFDDVEDSGYEDAVDTLNLIVQSHESGGDTADFSHIRCAAVMAHFRRRAYKMSKAFAAFAPTCNDVIDLFTNTMATDMCCHGNVFRLALRNIS